MISSQILAIPRCRPYPGRIGVVYPTDYKQLSGASAGTIHEYHHGIAGAAVMMLMVLSPSLGWLIIGYGRYSTLLWIRECNPKKNSIYNNIGK